MAWILFTYPKQINMNSEHTNPPLFERFSNKITQVTGSSAAFAIATSTVIIWAVSGPFFNYSEYWQLMINTGTTIITFLMVFLIQKSQNKDSKAIQLKLNELIAATRGASNRLVGAEDLTEQELDELRDLYMRMAEVAMNKKNKMATTTIEKEITHLGSKVEHIEEKVDQIEEQVDELKDNIH